MEEEGAVDQQQQLQALMELGENVLEQGKTVFF